MTVPVTIGFIDNDILLKLIAFQLFEEAISSLGLTQSDLRVLPSAKFVFQKMRQQSIYSDDVLQQAIDLANSCKSIPPLTNTLDPATIAEAQQISALDAIHQGESRLILSTLNTTGFLLLSGDKNCLKVLSQLPPQTYKRLCSQVICLEQLVLALIDSLGFSAVSCRVIPAAKCDKTIQICFGYSKPAAEVREALQSYINDIHSAAPGLLRSLT